MKHFAKVLAVAAAVLGAKSVSAGYIEQTIQGNSCVSTTPGNDPVYSQWGPYNNSTTTPMMLTCPISVPTQNYYYGQIITSGWTRHSSDQVYCNFGGTDKFGNGNTSVQAKVPYNGGANSGLANLNLPAGSTYLSVTCHLPVATNPGKSYLSSIWFAATW